MALADMFIEINDDVKDLNLLDFELTQTQGDYVPNYEDQGLTFERGKVKKAKLIETCVLYADIRNSTELSKSYPREIIARLYTAFVKSALTIAEYHGGVVRNIIGDRVMVVFPQKNCFTNALDTAVSINTVATRIINKHFKDFEFSCGIGIDYGEMKVIKAGISKQDKERTSYKNLVWIGNPANIASKLTDIANKETTKTIYRVTRNPFNWRTLWPNTLLFAGEKRPLNEPLYLDTIEVVDLSPDEFANSIHQHDDGSFYTTGGKMIRFEKKEIKEKHQPILMTKNVWEGFKESNPNRDSIAKKLWTIQETKIKDYTGQIVGGNVIWLDIEKIKI